MLSPLSHLAQPATLLGVLAALVVGVLIHNWAQVLAGQALGDSLASRTGWLRASVARHFDVLGSVAMVLTGVGWPACVPLGVRQRSRRVRTALALLAGPLAYFLLTVAAVALLARAQPTSAFGIDALVAAAYTFAALTVFSLVPVPPLDGGRIVFTLAPVTSGWQRARYHLEEGNVGVAIALGLLLLPLLFAQFPSVVDQLAPPLLRQAARLVGF